MNKNLDNFLTKLQIAAITAIIVSCLAAIAFGFIQFANYTFAYKFTLFIAAVTTLLNFAAVPFFLIGLPKFKNELRRAYIILCIGIALFGLAQVQLPLVNVFSLGFWVDYGGIAVPYLLAVVCIFWGARTLARLLDIKSVWTSFTAVTGCAIGLAILGSFLPHLEMNMPELAYDISLALSIWDTVFAAFAAMIIWQCKNVLGRAYMSSITWLYRALGMLAFGGLHYSIIQLLYTDGDWYYDYSFTIIPFALGALLLIKAGYEFNTIYKEELKETAEQRQKATSIDVVTYVAGLASKPGEVAPIISSVRAIAEKYSPTTPLSSEEQAALAAAYIQLENYLINHEALRIFTKEGLRNHINRKFEVNEPSQSTIGQFFSRILGDHG